MKPISLLIPAKGVLEVSWLGLPFRGASSFFLNGRRPHGGPSGGSQRASRVSRQRLTRRLQRLATGALAVMETGTKN